MASASRARVARPVGKNPKLAERTPAENAAFPLKSHHSGPWVFAAETTTVCPVSNETDRADEAGEGDPGDLDASAEPEVYADALPSDLDISGLIGPYEFPNNNKRRLAAVLYLAVGAICVWLGVAIDSPLVNTGLAVVGVALIVFAAYSWLVGVGTEVEETDALVIAARTVGFPPGHASAQMSWRGWRSRPAWRILLYSDESQPLQRALVVVDGVSGDVIEQLVEENPEDWSNLIA